MFRIIKDNRILFFIYFLFFVAAGLLLLHSGKLETHLLLNGFHTRFLDNFMRFITLLGNGIFMVFIGLLLLFKKIRYGMIMLSSFAVSSIMVQILKRTLFSDLKRPVAWFKDYGIEIYRISGLDYHSAFSFPSGHTTTCFALFFGLSFLIRNNPLKILFLLLALITGFSRIYLSQHFLGDVLAGSVLGIISAMIFQWIFEKNNSEWLNKNATDYLKRKHV